MDGQNGMHSLRITGILLLALAAGCANGKKAPPEAAVEADARVAAPAPAPEPAIAETAPAAPPIEPAPITAAPGAVAAEPPAPEVEPVETAPSPPAPAAPAPPKMAAEKPVPDAPAPVTPAPEPVAPAKPAVAPPAAAKPPAPTLDVNALKEKLKETKAIGVFTKLALKNQVDDLLQQFQAHYQSRQKSDLATLRQAYNMLVLKVLSLIQDGDPQLAHTIAASREAIWGMLADPVRFNSLM